MKTLHIAPSAARDALIQAIRDAGQDDEVLPFHDDLSCGPIDSDVPSDRVHWWRQFYEASEMKASLDELGATHGEFWERVATTDDRLVVWFGRHAAQELAFFLAWADRLGERPYHIIDVTGLRLPFRQRDGSIILSRPATAASLVSSEGLSSLLGKEQPITAQERADSSKRWQQLRSENAPFRVVTETGLVSASLDYFDPQLLAHTTSEWQKIARIVGSTLVQNFEPYHQVGDVTLFKRIAVLVDEGQLLADDDPRKLSCHIRLADSDHAAARV